MLLHFEHLNLKQNPFGSREIDSWAQSIVLDARDYLPFIGQKQTVLFLGEKGEGKTSHMIGLQRSFPDSVYLRLPSYLESEAFPVIPDVPILFLDECQRLLPWQFPYVFRKDRTVVLGSHRNHKYELALLGWTTKVVSVAQKDPQKIQKILQIKIEQVRRKSGLIPSIKLELVFYLQQKYGSKIRAMESELYDIFQSAKSIEHLQQLLHDVSLHC